MKLVAGTSLLLILLVACNVVPYTMPRPIEESPRDLPVIEKPVLEPPVRPDRPNPLPEVTATLRTCRQDDECVSVKADCCGCSAGGQAATINKNNVRYWENTLAVKCEDIACIQVISNHWTCNVQVRCVQNKCTLVKPS